MEVLLSAACSSWGGHGQELTDCRNPPVGEWKETSSWEEVAFQSKSWLRDEGEKFPRVTSPPHPPSTPFLAQLDLPQDVIH